MWRLVFEVICWLLMDSQQTVLEITPFDHDRATCGHELADDLFATSLGLRDHPQQNALAAVWPSAQPTVGLNPDSVPPALLRHCSSLVCLWQ